MVAEVFMLNKGEDTTKHFIKVYAHVIQALMLFTTTQCVTLASNCGHSPKQMFSNLQIFALCQHVFENK